LIESFKVLSASSLLAGIFKVPIKTPTTLSGCVQGISAAFQVLFPAFDQFYEKEYFNAINWNTGHKYSDQLASLIQ